MEPLFPASISSFRGSTGTSQDKSLLNSDDITGIYNRMQGKVVFLQLSKKIKVTFVKVKIHVLIKWNL